MKTLGRYFSFVLIALLMSSCSSLSSLVEKPGLSVANFSMVDGNLF